jgi:hypothetical protein
MQLAIDKLNFVKGTEDFTKEEFKAIVEPYMPALNKVNRTNYLVAFKYGDGSPSEATGYRTNTTIDVTINSRVLKTQKTGGKWAIYSYSN